MVATPPAVLSIPFPSPSSRLVREPGAGHLRLRPFGDSPTDLEVDFGRAAAEVTTDLIVACAVRAGDGPIDRRVVEELTVSARIVCLLVLARLDGVEDLGVTLRCSAAGCGERFEVELSIDEVLAFAPTDAGKTFEASVSGEPVQLRSPTGSDQLAWQSGDFDTPEAAREAVLRSLIVSPPPEVLSRDWLDALEAVLDEHDPLVCFGMEVVCPACQASQPHEVALAGLALAALHRTQSRLLESVHHLASRYGWTEREVLALPAWRRERYVALAITGAS